MYRAKLIAFSAVPKIYEGELSTAGIENIQDLIAYCARVSNPKNQDNKSEWYYIVRLLVREFSIMGSETWYIFYANLRDSSVVISSLFQKKKIVISHIFAVQPAEHDNPRFN